MKKAALSWSVKQFNKMFNRGTISFDYPIQRAGEQWDSYQKSGLIHSLADDYPVPALYSIKDGETYYILDGKQRLTTIIDFVNNKYPLHAETESVTIDEQSYSIAECLFEELHEEVRDAILSYMLLIYKLDEATDSEIENLFFKLNNGTPLSKQQKSKSKMGTKWARKFKEVMEHNFLKEKAAFSPAQIRKADDETVILQTMMIMDSNFELKSISSNHVFEYTSTFKEDEENKLNLLNNIVETMDYLDQAFQDKEKVLGKKVHLPMLLLTAQKAIIKDIGILEFRQWAENFVSLIKDKDQQETFYLMYCGQGTVKKEKALGRVEEMEKHFNNYFELAETASK